MSNNAFEEFDLYYRLSRTAQFRQEKSKKHPEDTRNAKAVDLLLNLMGGQASPDAEKGLSDAIIEYETACADVVFDAETPPFEQRVGETLGSIGFSWTPKTFEEVVTALTTDAQLATEEVKARAAA